jgi:hypothetical protein
VSIDDFAETYSRMADEELLALVSEQLVATAQLALSSELSQRGLKRRATERAPGFETVQTETPKVILMGRPVGGWLRFLCLHSIVGSVLGLVALGVANHNANRISPESFREFPRLYQILVGNTIACATLFLGQFYAGLGLLKKWPNALTIAHASMLALMIYIVVIPFFPYLIGAPVEFSNRLARSLAMDLIFPLVWLGAWEVYLLRSRRVRETYPQP